MWFWCQKNFQNFERTRNKKGVGSQHEEVSNVKIEGTKIGLGRSSSQAFRLCCYV